MSVRFGEVIEVVDLIIDFVDIVFIVLGKFLYGCVVFYEKRGFGVLREVGIFNREKGRKG